METCDTNILLYSLHRGCPEHAKAKAYIDAKATDHQFAVCELVLAELYALIRSPVIWEHPLPPDKAVETVQRLRENPHWQVLDYPGGLMGRVWELAADPQFPRAGVFDARLAVTLRHFGVTRFATRNVKHFALYEFESVFDPTL